MVPKNVSSSRRDCEEQDSKFLGENIVIHMEGGDEEEQQGLID